MSIYKAIEDEDDEELPDPIASDAMQLGVDADRGCEHWYSRIAGTVWVRKPNGEIANVHNMPETAGLENYISAVDEQVGWEDLNYAFGGIVELMQGIQLGGKR